MFKSGDIVRRVGGSDHPEHNMFKGRKYTVKNCNDVDIKFLESGNATFSPHFFEKVDSQNCLIFNFLI